VVAAALAGAVAMTAYLAASRLLTLPVFGLLSYVEPVLLVGVALLLGDVIAGWDVVVYALLAGALGLLSLDGFRAARSRPGLAPGGERPRVVDLGAR
jgi:chloramphenicol-sensitive protein RarD